MDYALESTFDYKFTSRAFATGIPTTLAGTPVIDIYEDNSTTEITGAETLSVDFDGVTGLNNLRIVATAANGFESGKSYAAVITTGTVGGVSVVGETVLNFTIQRTSAVRPTTAGRTLDVTATGAAGIDWANVENQGTSVDLSATTVDSVDDVTGAVGSVAGNVDGDVSGNVDGTVAGKTPAEVGDAMTLAADAIKATTYDESTAFPIKSADTGATQIARTGADSDTLETISDEIAALNNISVADIIAGITEGTLDLQEILRIILSATAGITNGFGTDNPNFRDVADSKDRIAATVDGEGNRTAITLDGS